MSKRKRITPEPEPELPPVDLEPIIASLREIGPDGLLLVAIKGNVHTDLSTIEDSRELERLFKSAATTTRLRRVFE
jgi:hypothetical protein